MRKRSDGPLPIRAEYHPWRFYTGSTAEARAQPSVKGAGPVRDRTHEKSARHHESCGLGVAKGSGRTAGTGPGEGAGRTAWVAATMPSTAAARMPMSGMVPDS